MFDDYKINNEIKFSYPLIQIKGGLPHLQQLISKEVLNDLKGNNPKSELLAVKRYSSDIIRFINSLEKIDTGITYAGLSLTLEESNYEFVPRVEEQGQYSRKGDVISFWPIGYSKPIRADFFDEVLEKMVSYDELYGRKYSKKDRVYIGKVDILDDKVEWSNLKFLSQAGESKGTKFSNEFREIKTQSELVVAVFSDGDIASSISIDLSLSYPNLFYSRFDIFKQEIKRLEELKYNIDIVSFHQSGIPQDLHKYLKKDDLDITAGFVDSKNKKVVFTDRELFGTVYITKEKKKTISSRQAKNLLSEIEGEIEIGDYIVHEDHGIGIYAGITREKDLEYLLIQYAEGDELLIPLDKLFKVTKYIGVSNSKPEVTRLHKGNWNTVTEKTKKGINIIARELVQHYAKLELAKAPVIEKETEEEIQYKNFVENFPYEETPDQKRTIDEVMADLSTDEPMNRLIVGDVGFGKTEVAMRAAFQVAQQGLQVAVLAPTTVLAAQHYKVFKDRFEDFGFKIAMMSRFTGKNENSDIAEKLGENKIDIVVGTHRLLSNDVKFAKLGLIIIDEEQKFGVRQKEKLKKLKYGSHILSMTATPIPRTLSMALSQIQDISIITTPPKNRKVIKTEVERINWNKVVEAIKYEVSRGGQVYFVHNRVQTIDSVRHKLETLLPNIKFVVGHGQMNENQLENVINDFYSRKYDCLICTTIIENGIDMPNVNTIIIDKSQNFGLGQLYQLRGRVGRGDEQAYAYLFYDGEDVKEDQEEEENKELEEEEEKKYIKRLKAVLEAQELGAGFKIASRDLEIRGAGNLLGKEQHGQISKVGLALYMQMLAEEIEKIKVAEENLE